MTDVLRQWQLDVLGEKMNTFANSNIAAAVMDAKLHLLKEIEGPEFNRIVPEDLAPWLSDERDSVRELARRLVRTMPMTQSVSEGWETLMEGEFWRFAEWCETVCYRLDAARCGWTDSSVHVMHDLATVFVATQCQLRTKAWIRRVPPQLFASAIATTDRDLRFRLMLLTHEVGADLPPCFETDRLSD
jgi:hypothetical protein